MNPEDFKKPGKLDDIRKRLYIKEDKNILRRRFGVLHDTEKNASTDWLADKPNPLLEEDDTHMTRKTPLLTKTPLFKKFFIGALLFFVMTMGVVAYQFLGGHNEVSADGISINILGNAYTAGGEELPLQVELKNQNPVGLELADLIIEYPRGSDEANGSDIVRTRNTIGTLGANDSTLYNTKITLYGEQGSTKNIHFTLEYRLRGSNAIFTKDKDYTVTINSAPVSLTVEGPTETNPNQEIKLKIHTSLNATKTVEGMLVGADYPPGFTYIDSVPKPVYSNNIWELGSLDSGKDQVIEVRGTLFGSDGEDKSFRVYGGIGSGNDQSKVAVVYNSYLHTIAIKKPFLETHIVIDDSDADEVAITSGESVRIKIPWANNLSSRILNAQITAKLSGNAYDPTAVQAGTGFFDSNANTISWDKNTVPAFASIEPGKSDYVTFTLTPAALENANHTFLTNPKIVIEVSIKGTQTDAGNITTEVKGSESKTAKVTTNFKVAADAVYSTGPFTNTGPVPPKAGQTTTYTIIWRITNTANRVTGAEVRTTLPSWINWKSTISPANANITYIDSTREVVWKVGAVDSGAGLGGSSKEAAFQISFTPSSSQVGSIPELITETNLSGQDSFTGVQLKSTKNFLLTKLTNDPQYSGSSGKVE